MAFRVKFVYDTDAQFEESNGEARPLTEAEYKDNEYYACPVHTRGDKSADLQENGIGTCMRPVAQSDEDAANSRPGAAPAVCGKRYAPIPYDEYLAYYGNPDRHVYLGVIVEKQCGECHKWSVAGSLWHIDFMDDSREYLRTNLDHYYTPEEAIALPGYAGDVAGEVLSEAGYEAGKAPANANSMPAAIAALERARYVLSGLAGVGVPEALDELTKALELLDS